MTSAMKTLSACGRLWVGSAFVVFVIAASTSRCEAQAIPETPIFWTPPWNALHVFDPTPLPLLSDPTTREVVAPEDTPVRGRQWPEYQPRGIRYGAWMFDPAVSAGGFYDSNVFSSSTDREADLGSKLGASLHAHSLWERHGLDLTLSTASTIYREHSGLNHTDASLRGLGHVDIDHATTIL
ncbi:MAG TPA: outer membrane beta-barrel protein, partial [Pseudolabrys sp.]|nr:outer membrane beta-barrel protein [Pseudolabrys sp.]